MTLCLKWKCTLLLEDHVLSFIFYCVHCFFGSIHIVALLSSPLFMLDLFQIQFPAGVKRYLTQSHSPSAFSQQKEVDEETLEL